MAQSDTAPSDTATSLLALALGLLGAVLLTFLSLALGYLGRGSPGPALALLILAALGGFAWRRGTKRARERAAAVPLPSPRADPGLDQARARLLTLPEFTLEQARERTGLEIPRLEALLDALLEAGVLRAETRGEVVVYRTLHPLPDAPI